MSEMGGSRSVAEMQASLRELNRCAKDVKDRIRELEADKESLRKNVTSLERQVGDARQRLNEQELQLAQANALKERIDDYKGTRSRQNTVIGDVDGELEELTPKILAAGAKLKETMQECSEKEQKQQGDAARLSQSDMNLQSIQNRIHAYLRDGGLERLDLCQAEVRRLQTEDGKLSAELAKTTEEISKLEKQEADAGSTQRTITENIRYRRNQAELQEIKREIEELEGQHADREHSRYTEKAQRLDKKHVELSTEVGSPSCPSSVHDSQCEICRNR